MFSAALIQKMKQNNISFDAGKTKDHVSKAWKAASKAKQDAITELAGVARSTVHRAYRTGGISAKLVMALAQVLDMDPFYFTGASDLPGNCTDEFVVMFLQTHNYNELIYEWNKSERNQPSAVSSPPAEPPANAVAVEAPEDPEPDSAVLALLTDEELVILVRSLIIKARSDARSAKTLQQLKHLLLT